MGIEISGEVEVEFIDVEGKGGAPPFPSTSINSTSTSPDISIPTPDGIVIPKPLLVLSRKN